MGFDRFRRFDSERPVYRFFPNRTKAQTRALSWVVLGGGVLVTLLFVKAFEKNDLRLREYYTRLAAEQPRPAISTQVRGRRLKLGEAAD